MEDTWRLAMDAARLRPGGPEVLHQQLLAAAAISLMGHCALRDADLLASYQQAAISLTVSLEAQVPSHLWAAAAAAAPPRPPLPTRVSCVFARMLMPRS